MNEKRKRSKAEIKVLSDRLNGYMEEKRLRSTAQRRTVTNIFLRSREHFTIEGLLREVRLQDPKIGYATVYRTLKLLAKSGVANERHFGDGISRYEVADADHHDHILCTECGLIVEFENDEIEVLQEKLAHALGFQLTRHRLDLYGICKTCKKESAAI